MGGLYPKDLPYFSLISRQCYAIASDKLKQQMSEYLVTRVFVREYKTPSVVKRFETSRVAFGKEVYDFYGD